MTTDLDKLPLPPGQRAFPLLGDTLQFLADPFTFIALRVEKNGPVFRTNLLGRRTVILAGPKVSHVFLDESLTAREGSMPGNVQELFGGQSLPLLDGAAHKARKRQVLSGFLPEVLPSYVPAMESLIEASFSDFARRGEVRADDELKRLAITLIARNVIGLDPGPDLDTLLNGLKALTAAFGALPIPLPGTAYKKGLAARDSILAVLRRVVADHRSSPRDDALGKMLAHRGDDGAALSDEAAALELHHVFLAGYIVFAELSALLVRLAERADLRAALTVEVDALPQGPLTARAVLSLPALSRVVQETKRITPVVPISFGRAKTTFAIEGYRVPEGTMLYWAPWSHNQDAATFPAPERFDPGRFADDRAEHKGHEHAYAPQGLGGPLGHKCPGTDYATLVMSVFAVVLLRSYSWRLPEQDLGLNRGKLPPEHKDGLRVVLSCDRSAPVTASPKVDSLKASPAGEGSLSAAALALLASVIWADGVMADEEAKALVQVARASGLGPDEVAAVERAVKDRAPVPEVIPTLSASAAEQLYALGCLLAASDGTVEPSEREALTALADRLSLDEEARARASRASMAIARIAGVSGQGLTALAAEMV